MKWKGGSELMRKIRIKCIALALALLILLGGCGSGFLSDLYPTTDSVGIPEKNQENHKGSEANSTGDLSSDKDDDPADRWIYVHVCGCVIKPGLYRFKDGARIDEAIRAAGGFSKDADEKSVNLAQIMTDGSQIEVLPSGVTEEKNPSGDSRINLNLAQKEDLMTLTGIGENRALAIIAYREEHGGFTSVEELKKVEGIGDGIYQKIKNSIKI